MSWTQVAGRAYWIVFAGAFLVVATWESHRPTRRLSVREERRWSRHGVMMALGFTLTAALYRVSPALMAVTVASSELGVLNRAWLPLAARWALAILLLDLVRYAVHLAHHSVPLLWRVHQVHHSDPDLDASTGARFHPIELIVTQGAYLAAIAVLAPPVGAVVVTELLFGFQSVFSHANSTLPDRIESVLRLVWVTPSMHRIHHSDRVREQGGNLGDLLSWWDRLFRTYVAAPEAGLKAMRPGLEGFQNESSLDLGFMLGLPFRRRSEESLSS
jgi:sterol desaturase/sphingolipid hydroxylase (fatty acid hydroxylase superfamily)